VLFVAFVSLLCQTFTENEHSIHKLKTDRQNIADIITIIISIAGILS